jgi:hypothetical protein
VLEYDVPIVEMPAGLRITALSECVDSRHWHIIAPSYPSHADTNACKANLVLLVFLSSSWCVVAVVVVLAKLRQRGNELGNMIC